MGPLEGRSIAVLTLLGVLGISQHSVVADDRAAPLECSQAAEDRVGTLSGTVSDVSGTGISGALITASWGSFREGVTTDSIGAYRLQLSPGSYRVRVTADNYSPTEREVVLAATSPVVEWKVTLTLAPVKTRRLDDLDAIKKAAVAAWSKSNPTVLEIPISGQVPPLVYGRGGAVARPSDASADGRCVRRPQWCCRPHLGLRRTTLLFKIRWLGIKSWANLRSPVRAVT